MRTIKRKESSPNYVQRFYLLSFLFIQRHQPFLATLPYFAMNGVPTISFNLKDPKGYDFSYNEIWHTERDTYNKSIPEYQEHTSTCLAVVLYGLANLNHILDRTGLYAE